MFHESNLQVGFFMDYVLGIDVGTGGTRAVLVDCNGAIASSATCEHVPFASPQTGWAEQDPHDWWKAAGSAIRAALANIPGATSPYTNAITASHQYFRLATP